MNGFLFTPAINFYRVFSGCWTSPVKHISGKDLSNAYLLWNINFGKGQIFMRNTILISSRRIFLVLLSFPLLPAVSCLGVLLCKGSCKGSLSWTRFLFLQPATFWGAPQALGQYVHTVVPFWKVSSRAKRGVSQTQLERHHQQLLQDGGLTVPMAVLVYSSQPLFNQVWKKSSPVPKSGLRCGNVKSFAGIFKGRGGAGQGEKPSSKAVAWRPL